MISGHEKKKLLNGKKPSYLRRPVSSIDFQQHLFYPLFKEGAGEILFYPLFSQVFLTWLLICRHMNGRVKKTRPNRRKWGSGLEK